MVGVLLDTHALFWLVTSVDQLSEEALLAIADAQVAGKLYVSPITAWELSIASRKPAHRNPPDLGEQKPSKWFADALSATTAKIVPIKQTIAIDAANLVVQCGHKDPGDCFLISTARIKKLKLITRDQIICELSRDYGFEVIIC